MKFRLIVLAITIQSAFSVWSQAVEYQVSFEDAVHHVAAVQVAFSGLDNQPLIVKMSRTSPGRYALHEFAKNVYNVTAVNEIGESLAITQTDPSEWEIAQHNGYAKVSYKLFANKGHGTYAQIDETHAHLNVPAVFMYAPSLEQRAHHVRFELREDLQWKVATQLQQASKDLFIAPNLYYFMDSPIEISNYQVKEFTCKSNRKKYKIKFVLHGAADPDEFNAYFEDIQAIVKEESAVFGELPNYDFETYTFLACYIPNATGDGMEHRNSTILTSSENLHAGRYNHIGTAAHEFFHAWNVERIRPESLEPFNFEETNMSGELWFAEGFTSYYAQLILCRAGIISPKVYVKNIANSLNQVWNAPGLMYRTPIEMSYYAPFVDAAASIDPTNRVNNFVSYYTYGSVLGLALDLSLRDLRPDLSLDGFMRLFWHVYGTNERPYTITDLMLTLSEYASEPFANFFFNEYVYRSNMPDYKRLLAGMGVNLQLRNTATPYFGASVYQNQEGLFVIWSNPLEGAASYMSKLAFGDVITSINGIKISVNSNFDDFIAANFSVGQSVEIVYDRFGKSHTTQLTFGNDSSNYTELIENVTADIQMNRENWLESKVSK